MKKSNENNVNGDNKKSKNSTKKTKNELPSEVVWKNCKYGEFITITNDSILSEKTLETDYEIFTDTTTKMGVKRNYPLSAAAATILAYVNLKKPNKYQNSSQFANDAIIYLGYSLLKDIKKDFRYRQYVDNYPKPISKELEDIKYMLELLNKIVLNKYSKNLKEKTIDIYREISNLEEFNDINKKNEFNNNYQTIKEKIEYIKSKFNDVNKKTIEKLAYLKIMSDMIGIKIDDLISKK